MSSLFFFTIVALIPILGWIYFFQTQHHENRSYVVITFLAGMLSVVPIKFYERYWDITVFKLEHINLFERIAALTHLPTLDTFLAYVLTSVVVSFGLFIFAAIILFLLEILAGDDTVFTYEKKIKKVGESPLLFVMTGVVFGVAAYILNIRLDRAIWFFVMVGVLEEYMKHLVTRFSDETHIRNVSDALSFSIIAALGFAFVENVIYFLNISSGQVLGFQELLTYVVLRSVISVVAHVGFSSILGYYYGIAHCASEVYRVETQGNRYWFLKILHRVSHLKEENLFKEEKMLEGMIAAVLAHAIFNSLLEFNYMGAVIIFLCGLFFLVLHLLHRMEVYERLGIAKGFQKN